MKLKKGVALLLASAAMVSLAGCGGNSGGSGSNASNAAGGNSELPTLRVAAMPTITSLPTYYIQKNGLDEKAGFKMEVTMFDTGAPMNEALAADLWDVGQMGAAAVTGMANYDELIIGEVLESTDGQGVFVSPDCPVAQDTGFNPSFPLCLEARNPFQALPFNSSRNCSALYRFKMAGKAGNGADRCQYCKHGHRTGLSGTAGRTGRCCFLECSYLL